METPRKFITANKTIICFIAMQTYKELVRILYIDNVLPELRLHAAQLLYCVVLCCVDAWKSKLSSGNLYRSLAGIEPAALRLRCSALTELQKPVVKL